MDQTMSLRASGPSTSEGAPSLALYAPENRRNRLSTRTPARPASGTPSCDGRALLGLKSSFVSVPKLIQRATARASFPRRKSATCCSTKRANGPWRRCTIPTRCLRSTRRAGSCLQGVKGREARKNDSGRKN
ncbi:hypothetical protein AG1IA_05571 [Rhizoctonia solani AG-1 IA]|uniref:Uncharacterized protein n=1 Tax=Thanatephorus cucumeris (strain AG1-IA) TaxID=983506 RepID=L8WQX2_THACA|nr:hypothetical protein AG1IA_05571 [Rhizoctonia solani AG-1 IA]